MSDNPYGTSTSNFVKESSDSEFSSHEAMASARVMAMWQTLVGCLLACAAGLFLLCYMAMLVGSFSGGGSKEELIATSIFMVIASAIFAFPIINLFRSAIVLRRWSRSEASLESAMNAQKRFWLSVAIIGIIFSSIVTILVGLALGASLMPWL